MNRVALILALLFVSGVASAADDHAAGLFAEAQQLPLVSQTMFVEVAADEATIRLIQVFANDGPAIAQADLILPLPDGATVEGFGFYQGTRFLEAGLKEKSEAEAAHREAAAAGRATGLVVSAGRSQRFSVYPVPAGEKLRIEARLRLPVVAELGRRHLSLPIRALLGRQLVRSAVLLSITSEAEIQDIRLNPGGALLPIETLGRRLLAFSTREETEVSWREPGPALALSAAAIALPEGGFAIETKVAFNRAPPRSTPGPKWRHLIVDASRSMKRRQRLVQLVVERLQQAEEDVGLSVHYLAERRTTIEAPLQHTRFPPVGFRLSPEVLDETLRSLDCGRADRACIYLGDLSSEGLDRVAASEVPMVLLADAYEERRFAKSIPRAAAVFVEGADNDARLLSQVDELILPVLAIVSQTVHGGTFESKGRKPRRVAAGGFLRTQGRVDHLASIELQYALDQTLFHRRLEPELLDLDSAAGMRLRRSYYESHLETELVRYAAEPSGGRKRAIIELSLREKIPTPFTALQVDGPRTSLFDIKPGDPLLSVADEPGLAEAVAYFPFGEALRLVRADDGRLLGRFLVPRGYPDRVYAIEIVKRFDDGRTKLERAFFRIDSTAPKAVVSINALSQTLEVDTGEDTPEVAAVWAEVTAKGQVPFGRQGTRFARPLSDLGRSFRIHVRDRAGNLAMMHVEVDDRAELLVHAEPQPSGAASIASRPLQRRPMSLAGAGPDAARLEGSSVLVELGGKERSFDYDGTVLRSLGITARLEFGKGSFLVGTDAGDLVELSCPESGARCRGQRRNDFGGKPIVGLAKLNGERVLIAVRDEGLFEWTKGKVRRSRTVATTNRVTGLATHQGRLYLATANRGLLIWRSGVWQASRLDARRVFGLTTQENALIAHTDTGTHQVVGPDRFQRTQHEVEAENSESKSLTSAAVLNGRLYVGGFDAGLFVVESGLLLRVPMQSSITARHINRLLSVDGALIIASEAGVVRAEPRDGAWRFTTLLEGAAHDLSTDGVRIAIASARGLFVGRGNRFERWDGDDTERPQRYSSVAWHDGALYAGGLAGLHRYKRPKELRVVSGGEGLRSTWVTALRSTDEGLYVGTYDEGVGLYTGTVVHPVSGLSGQWVPFGAIRELGATLYVGGLGMPPAIREGGGEARALAVPSRDVNDFIEHEGQIFLMTRDGLATLQRRDAVALAR